MADTLAEMKAQIEQMKAQMAVMAKAEAEAKAKLAEVVKASVGMTDSGCVTLKGIRKSYGGVHLYSEEWAFIAENIALVLDFAKTNAVELKRRSDANRAAKLEAKDADRKARVASFTNGGSAHKVG